MNHCHCRCTEKWNLCRNPTALNLFELALQCRSVFFASVWAFVTDRQFRCCQRSQLSLKFKTHKFLFVWSSVQWKLSLYSRMKVTPTASRIVYEAASKDSRNYSRVWVTGDHILGVFSSSPLTNGRTCTRWPTYLRMGFSAGDMRIGAAMLRVRGSVLDDDDDDENDNYNNDADDVTRVTGTGRCAFRYAESCFWLCGAMWPRFLQEPWPTHLAPGALRREGVGPAGEHPVLVHQQHPDVVLTRTLQHTNNRRLAGAGLVFW